MPLTTVNVWPADFADALHYWRARFSEARTFMETRRHLNPVLIEIAAQHPLIDGKRPGSEFSARLERGVELFRKFSSKCAVEIYVPGSRHAHEGSADDISLSSAGTNYLRKAGIPDDVLHGDNLNFAYKGEDGVYSSADECFVTASYFKQHAFGRLVSVVSPAQLFRKTLHYAALGVLPLSYTAPTDSMFHDYVEEVFYNIPYVLMVDHDLQSPGSEAAAQARAERNPDLS